MAANLPYGVIPIPVYPNDPVTTDINGNAIVGNLIANVGIQTPTIKDVAGDANSGFGFVAAGPASTGLLTGAPVLGTGGLFSSNGQFVNNTTASSMFIGAGLPGAGLGANGDFYLRTDGTEVGHTVIYHKEAGAWVATAA